MTLIDSRHALLLASFVALAACTTEDSGSEGVDTAEGEEPTWPMVESDQARDENPQIDPDEILALAADNHALSIDLYQGLREGKAKDKGFSISAYSIQSAFGMLYGGTVEPAASEMEAALHFSLVGERQHVGFNWLDHQLHARNIAAIPEPEPQDPVIFETANGVWATPGVADSIFPAYLDLLAVHYGTGVALADFAEQSERERLDINEWVSIRTHTLIPEFFKQGVILPTTTMVLVNAIYMKAPWSVPFEESATNPNAEFTRLDGSKAKVAMMRNYDFAGGYGEGAGYRAVALPMRGDQLEMIAIVPDDFAAFEASLDVATLDEVLGSMQFALVDLGFPRFELEFDASLKTELQDLGLVTPFDDPSAFEGIMPGGPGVITEVIHHTVIKVDEKGTEAAAATGIVLGEDGGGGPEFAFSVDKPFLLLIRDAPTDTLLFFGRVLDPS